MKKSWKIHDLERAWSVTVKGALMDQNLEFMAQMPEEYLQVFVDTLLEKGGITETLSVSEDYKQFGKKLC